MSVQALASLQLRGLNKWVWWRWHLHHAVWMRTKAHWDEELIQWLGLPTAPPHSSALPLQNFTQHFLLLCCSTLTLHFLCDSFYTGLNLSPVPTREALHCGICMFFSCLCGFFPGYFHFFPQSKDRLATCPCCTPRFTLWQPDYAPTSLLILNWMSHKSTGLK